MNPRRDGFISKLSHFSNQTNFYLGVAQLVARYLGVVEAASSSLVTQTKKSLENIEFSRLFLILSTYDLSDFLKNSKK